MGLFWAGTFSQGVWIQAQDSLSPPRAPSPSLSAVIHDSDVVEIRVEPVLVGVGESFLHQTIRSYFDEDGEPPTDRAGGVTALVAWLEAFWPPSAAVSDLEATVSSFVVGDEDIVPEDRIFAEQTFLAFLEAVALPKPVALL